MQQKRGRKVFSLEVWAPTANIEAIRQQLVVEREKPQYAKRRQADAQRRERKQEEYVGSFVTVNKSPAPTPPPTRLVAAMNRTGKARDGFARPPGLPAELSQNLVHSDARTNVRQTVVRRRPRTGHIRRNPTSGR